MNPLLAPVLVMLQEEAVRLGSKLIEDGIALVRARLTGEASDSEILEWLAKAQEPS